MQPGGSKDAVAISKRCKSELEERGYAIQRLLHLQSMLFSHIGNTRKL